jgi:uncharacterized membrane protein (UPF0127 family)
MRGVVPRPWQACAVTLLVGCTHASPADPGRSGTSPPQTPRASRTEPEVVLTAPGGELRVKVEIARSEPERQRGLMFRQSLADGRGMLFLFERPDRLKFWMKNTYIPLDMLFLDAQRRVIFIEENAEPLTLNPRGPEGDAQFVLEVPGGWARKHGIQPGVQARFEGVPGGSSGEQAL